MICSGKMHGYAVVAILATIVIIMFVAFAFTFISSVLFLSMFDIDCMITDND